MRLVMYIILTFNLFQCSFTLLFAPYISLTKVEKNLFTFGNGDMSLPKRRFFIADVCSKML